MTRRLVVLTAALVVMIGATVAGAGGVTASTSGDALYGTGAAGPCAPRILPPPESLRLLKECWGNAVLDGTWAGTIRFHARGKVDVVTGNASGTISELFSGRAPGVVGRGTVLMRGTFAVDGATGQATAALTIVRGTGAFRHARGSVTANGYMPITTGPQSFAYAGTWWPRG